MNLSLLTFAHYIQQTTSPGSCCMSTIVFLLVVVVNSRLWLSRRNFSSGATTSLAIRNWNYCTLPCTICFLCSNKLFSLMKYRYVHMEDLSVLSELRGSRTKDPCLLFVIIISEPPAVLFSCTAAANGGFHTSSNLQDERIFIQ